MWQRELLTLNRLRRAGQLTELPTGQIPLQRSGFFSPPLTRSGSSPLTAGSIDL